jgi:hypothetical protein
MITNVRNYARPVIPRCGKCNIDRAMVYLRWSSNHNTNKKYMDKDFKPGSILKQSDYTKSSKRNDELGLIAALCVGTLAFFVLKLLGAI